MSKRRVGVVDRAGNAERDRYVQVQGGSHEAKKNGHLDAGFDRMDCQTRKEEWADVVMRQRHARL
jgi:hypothetical protein